MPQRYKLRLGDGTVVAVDSDGLHTWAEDRRAMAQAVGTQHWRPLREVLVEEEAAARLARALVPPKPRQAAEPTPPPAKPTPPPPPTPPAAIPSPPLELPEFDLGAEPPPVSSRPSLQVLADDPVSSRVADPTPFSDPAADDMPIIPMKRVDEEPGFQSAWTDEGEPDDADEYLEDEEPRNDRLDGPLLTVLETVGGWLSRGLNRLASLAPRLSSWGFERSDPRHGYSDPRHGYYDLPKKAAARPELLTLAEDPEPDRSTPFERVSGWFSGLRDRFARSADAEPPANEPDRWREPPPPAPPRAEQPRTAPTPVSELPVLKFAEAREARERVDVYQDDGPSLLEGLEPIWRWTKRIVTTGALVAALAYAFVEREAWFPKAATVGQTTFTEIDRLVLARERGEQRRQALAAAAERLPGLAPETIELVFSRNPIGNLEPPAVFQVAREAAERGLATLPAADAAELQALQREVLDTLGPSERELVREYDRARSRRVIFPFENPHVMELVGRGARALPADRLERLRALTHQAVVAGLDRPQATAAASPAS